MFLPPVTIDHIDNLIILMMVMMMMMMVMSPQLFYLLSWPQLHPQETPGRHFQPADSPKDEQDNDGDDYDNDDDNGDDDDDDNDNNDDLSTRPCLCGCEGWTHIPGSLPTSSGDKACNERVYAAEFWILSQFQN